ncbi:MAG: hypothetical protein AABM66_04505 [Actinomycetota bacterium]
MASVFGELSDPELIAAALVISFGAPALGMLLVAPGFTISSSPGRLILGLATIAQLAVLAAQIADYGDPSLGIEGGAVAFRLVSAAFVVLVLTGGVRAFTATRPGRRLSNRGGIASRVGLVAALALLGGGAVAALADQTGLRCAAFSFDGDRWKSNRERVAESLVECETLIGKTRVEVREMLGPGGSKGRTEQLDAGWVSDAIGPGDGQLLIINYDSSSVVRRAHLLYPPD